MGGRVIGLTGGIGSGKSTVARRLAARGATVIDADQLARDAVAVDSPGLAAVVERFGPDVLQPDGALDRRAVGRIVFTDEAARRDLERIVHPEVARLAQSRIAAALEAGAPLVVYDVPLLYENGLDRLLPEVVVVTVDPETQRARIRGRDDLTEQEIEDRIASQMPLADKAERADHVIDNRGPLAATEALVDRLYDQLTEETP